MVGVQVLVLVSLVSNVWGSDYEDYDYFESLFVRTNSETTERVVDYERTFFPSLDNYDWQTKKVSEIKYPWVARVIHSTTQQIPHVCTAVCVDKRIFLTAARCIYSLKLKVTTVTYQYTSLTVKAFILPSNPTKQYFDDIGIIVTNAEPLARTNSTWSTIKLYDGKRTDNQFQWFADLNTTDLPLQKVAGKKVHIEPFYRVVGYAIAKFFHRIKTPYSDYHLSELDIMVGIKMCSAIYARNKTNDFLVPCYLPCYLEEFPFKSSDCKKYHGVEGSAIIDLSTGKLFGIGTWGGSFHKYDLPVGFSVPNSENFLMDYKCAKIIRDDKTELSYDGFFQTLCHGYT